ncbi:MAG TPA: DUF58 domain-containing protein [Planctomycetota bacterium]|nr:DUF58 domain-containing protein [Planctomycetota bacterium]
MALDIADLVKKVRRIQIVASKQVDDLLSGEYRSVFRGRGMEFDEVREYTPGDDVRTIDWNVTARAGKPFIKRFCEERELTVLFAVDVSASGQFGTTEGSKFDLAVEVAALLMLSAQKNNDKVGLLLFGEDVRGYFPPRKGRAATRRLIRELLAAEPKPASKGETSRPTDLSGALRYLTRVHRRRCVVFLISDFLDSGDYESAMRIARARHDVVAITITDPREAALPAVGFVHLLDPETGETLEVDTSHALVRKQFAALHQEERKSLEKRLRRLRVDQLPVVNDKSEPYTKSLHRFFRMREGRKS